MSDSPQFQFLKEDPSFGVKMLLFFAPLSESLLRKIENKLGYWTWTLVKRNSNIQVSPT